MAWKQTSDEYMQLRALMVTGRVSQNCEHVRKMSSIWSVLKQTLSIVMLHTEVMASAQMKEEAPIKNVSVGVTGGDKGGGG